MIEQQTTADRPASESPVQSVRVVFAALMLVMLLASLDQTIVSTALPTIVGELGGLAHLSWIERGRALFDRMVDAHRKVLQRLAARWSPEQHEEAEAMLDGLARNLIAELPIAPARGFLAKPVSH